MKDKEVAGYVQADNKARKLWGQSKQTDNEKKKTKTSKQGKNCLC